jgi:hypothetical protein
MFALATAKRAAEGRGPHQLSWAISLACFAAASAALALGASTGWDPGTYRTFYLGGAILSVPWLALGTVFLLFGGRAGRATRVVLVFFSGLATGVVFTAGTRADQRHRDPGRQGHVRDRGTAGAGGHRQRARCHRGDRGRGLLGRPAALRPHHTRAGPPRGSQRPRGPGHARAVERRARAGLRRPRRGVRAHARHRDRGDLRGLPSSPTACADPRPPRNRSTTLRDSNVTQGVQSGRR